MNEMQLKIWAKMIVTSMGIGDMAKVTEIYGMVSEKASMEEAAALEQMIASMQ